MALQGLPLISFKSYINNNKYLYEKCVNANWSNKVNVTTGRPTSGLSMGSCFWLQIKINYLPSDIKT